MIQLLMLGCSIGLVVLGIKGFTAGGLRVSECTTLQGTPAKIVGAFCIIGGILRIPAFLLFVVVISK